MALTPDQQTALDNAFNKMLVGQGLKDYPFGTSFSLFTELTGTFPTLTVTGNGTIGGTLGVTGALTGSSTLSGTSLIASGFNTLTVASSTTGNPLTLTATGGDASIDINLRPKSATGAVTSPTSFKAIGAFNSIAMAGSVHSAPVTVTATGTDTDVGISLVPKGVAPVQIPSGKILDLSGGGGNYYLQEFGGTSYIQSVTPLIVGTNTAQTVSLQTNGTNALVLDTSQNVQLSAGIITQYKGIATAGMGVSPIVAAPAKLTTSLGSITILSYTPPAVAGLYEVGGWFKVTAFTSGAITMILGYTDETGGVQSLGLHGQDAGGNVVYTLTATGTSHLFNTTISIDGSATPITLTTYISGTATVDFYGWIRRIS